ncbi:B12-binding domain-containing radical SAM protein, partial [Candidatus Omnitrophota bacterium]
LFVNLPAIPFNDLLNYFKGQNFESESVSMSMGILYLSSFIKKNNEVGKVRLLDYVSNIRNLNSFTTIDSFINEIAKKNVQFTPDIVAISLILSTSHEFFVTCINLLRVLWPKAVFIVGGTHATNCIKHLLMDENIDYVARGEGEIAFSHFITQFSSNKLIDVKGIYSKDNFSEEKPLEICDFVEDLDALPFPDWQLLKMKRYVKEKGRKRLFHDTMESKAATLITSRGCHFQCIFCTSRTVHGRRVRYRSVENVINEMGVLNKNYGVTLFIIEDDLFSGDKKRLLKFSERIKDLRINNLELQNPSGLSVATLDEQSIDALVDSGMKIFNIAIESGSEYVQKFLIKKNCDLKKAKRIVEYVKTKGLMVRCYFMLGFPNETKEMMEETVKYAKEIGSDWCIFSIAIPLIGSEMYEQFIKMGRIKDDISAWSASFFQERLFDTPEISAEKLKEYKYRVNLEINFIHNPNKENGRLERAIEIFKDVVLRHPYHIVAWYCILDCYRKMDDLKQVAFERKRILSLIKKDSRATAMFRKYEDLMPDLLTNS